MGGRLGACHKAQWVVTLMRQGELSSYNDLVPLAIPAWGVCCFLKLTKSFLACFSHNGLLVSA